MKRDLDLAFQDATTITTLRSPVFVACLVAIVGILAIYWPTVESIVAIWTRSETFAHGFIVVPLCVWLAWREREAIAEVPITLWLPGLAFVALSGAFWLLASAADALGPRQFALAFMLQAAIVTIVGLRMARVLAFPLAFLLFAVPAGEFMVPTLVDWTADFTVNALRLSGIPVYREANQFVLPTGRWSVVDACSGIRYLIASIMVGTIYAAVAYRTRRRRALFMTAAVLVPILANWLRAYLIVLLGHLSNNRLAAGVDHLIYGWLFFGFVMLLLFWVGSHWQERSVDPPEHPKTHRIVPRIGPAASGLAAAVAGAILIASIWPPLDTVVHRRVIQGVPVLGEIHASDGWRISHQIVDWTPNYSGFDRSLSRTYEGERGRVGVYVAYYRNQRSGHQLISSVNALVSEIGAWKVMASARDRLPWGKATTSAGRARLTGPTGDLDVFRLYWVGGHVTGSAYVAKLLQAWQRLAGQGDDAALIVIYAPIVSNEEAAHRSLVDFAAAMALSIERMLEQARRSSLKSDGIGEGMN